LRLAALALPLLLRPRLLGAALRLETGRAQQRVYLVRVEPPHLAPRAAQGQRKRPVAKPRQPRHGEVDRLEQLALLAVAAFLDDDLVPVVRAVLVAAGVLDLLDHSRA